MQTTARVRRRPPTKAANGKASPSQFDLKRLLKTLQAVRDGEFSVRLPGDYEGLEGKVAETLNEITGATQRLSKEMSRAGQRVGKEGKTRHRMIIDRRAGAW